MAERTLKIFTKRGMGPLVDATVQLKNDTKVFIEALGPFVKALTDETKLDLRQLKVPTTHKMLNG